MIVGNLAYDSDRDTFLPAPPMSTSSHSPSPAPEAGLRRRRRLSAPPAPSSISRSCSITPLEFPSTSPTQTLASLRLLVLAYLETLDRTLSAQASKSSSEWNAAASHMLAQFRASVISHLPHLWISDLSAIETYFRTQSQPAQLVLDDARDRFHDLDLEFHPSYYTAAIQTLSEHLRTLHEHLEQHVLRPGAALFPFAPVADALEGLIKQASGDYKPASGEQPLTFTSIFNDLREGLEANMEAITTESSEIILSALQDVSVSMHTSLANMKESIAHAKQELDAELSIITDEMSALKNEVMGDLEEMMDEVKRAMMRSVEGVQLIRYYDLPHEWRNNPFVVNGYRFIPVERWGLILRSVFEAHNETLNIHTHLIPFLLWFANLMLLLTGTQWTAPSWLTEGTASLKHAIIPAWLEHAYHTVGTWVDAVPTPPFPLSITPLIQQRLASPSSSVADHLIIPASSNPPKDPIELAFLAFSLLCLGSSATWHTMSGCADLRSMEFCARVDYIGIGWLISASVATVAWYGFSGCEEHMIYAKVFLGVCTAMGIMGNVFPFMKWFNMHQYRVSLSPPHYRLVGD